MALNLVAESERLVRDGLPAAPQAMTRRRRWAPVFVQRGDRSAIVLLESRSRRRRYLMHSLFVTGDGGWIRVGTWRELLDTGVERSDRRYTGDDRDAMRYVLESLSTATADRPGWRIVRLSSEVAQISFDGVTYVVPPDGRCAVSWTGRREPPITLLSETGQNLGSLTRRSWAPVQMPSRWMLRAARTRRAEPEGSWLNRAPADADSPP